ncbi:CRISPR-associated helicase Cas3' [Ruminococcus sp.]|uniref:CRISPR-associated helicase Cas3' n=1 Tax=Ruminococcus sp. TaxID=41978 RepID=UPI0025D547C3|nr:CRISPR-associated helicase Cas3' [Ruminococcus sp.]
MDLIAHISEDGTRTQTVREHIYETAELCRKFGKAAGLENLCYITGLFHDMGKLCVDFNGYILGENDYKRGDIDHSFAGAKYLNEFCKEKGLPVKLSETANLIARVIISHHGLHDWYNEVGKSYFEKRISVEDRYQEIKRNIRDIISDDELSKLLEKASEEYFVFAGRIQELSKKYEDKAKIKTAFAFYMGLFERYIQSILVDADRSNTAEFMTDNKRLEIECDTKLLWQAMNEKMEAQCEEFRCRRDKISRQRMSISDRCWAFADGKVGTCRLVVPTGGGKTLSSLRFAIKYAMKNDKAKIIYIAPFMSILEQNSDVISSFVDDKNLFTEHYSDALAKAQTSEELDEFELRCERLDAPVIAATFVQFLNSIFLGSMAAVRRFHRLENSVIIIDEVQSIPVKCVYMFDLAVNFLTKILGCTAVLCTATQPSLDRLDYPILFDDNDSMTGDFTKDFEQFKRTEIVPRLKISGYTFKEAAKFCADRLKENCNNSLLLVVNTKKAAYEIYKELSQDDDLIDSGTEVVHLSTYMCPQHRRDKISHIRKVLDNHGRLVCISTQLIEAGVDVSFDCTVRSLSGLDNIAQAAGRCNRNGEKDSAEVYVINIAEEDLSKLPEIKCRAGIGRQIFDQKFEDVLCDEVIGRYFHKFYAEQRAELFFPTAKADTTLFEMLSLNEKYRDKKIKPFYTNQAFATAGDLFEVIEDNAFQVVVPYNDEARALICDLGSDIPIEDFRLVRRKLQKYTVNTYYRRVLTDEAALVFYEKYNVYSVLDSYYSDEFGLTIDGASNGFLFG